VKAPPQNFNDYGAKQFQTGPIFMKIVKTSPVQFSWSFSSNKNSKFKKSQQIFIIN
jgi:hypothetical protein